MLQRDKFALAGLFSLLGYGFLRFWYVELTENVCLLTDIAGCIDDDVYNICIIDLVCKSKSNDYMSLSLLVEFTSMPPVYSYYNRETRSVEPNHYFWLCYIWMAYNVVIGIMFSNYISQQFMLFLHRILPSRVLQNLRCGN